MQICNTVSKCRNNFGLITWSVTGGVVGKMTIIVKIFSKKIEKKISVEVI